MDTASDEVVVLLLARLKVSAIAWGWWRIASGERLLRYEPGFRFGRALGSGRGGGFGLRPGLAHSAFFAVFVDEASADAFINRSDTVKAYRRRAIECCVFKLRATSCRGTWGGHSIAVTAVAPTGGPVASLTRASIRPRRARAFWRWSPPAEASLAQSRGCELAVGLGEAPVLRQATFSLWRDQSDMDAYARSGAHLSAIEAFRNGDFCTESMFVRFVPLAIQGSWGGIVRG
jgi:hypothetical protein